MQIVEDLLWILMLKCHIPQNLRMVLLFIFQFLNMFVVRRLRSLNHSEGLKCCELLIFTLTVEELWHLKWEIDIEIAEREDLAE